MPNSFAYLMLFSWPLVIVCLFAVLPRSYAIAISIIGGYLILPVRTGFNLPLVPTLDKSLLPSLFTAIMCLVVTERRARPPRRGPHDARTQASVSQGEPEAPRERPKPSYSRQPIRAAGRDASAAPAVAPMRTALPAVVTTGKALTPVTVQGERSAEQAAPMALVQPEKTVRAIVLALVALGLLSPIATALTNPDPLFFGSRFLPGLRLYDAMSMAMNVGVHMLPFVIGWLYLGSPQDLRRLVTVVALAGLAYSLPALFEVRMSPQLNTWIYGFFQHSFLQHIRASGYRPVVFLGHGLALSIFLAQTVFAAIALWRGRERGRGAGAQWLVAAAWLFMTLILSKSLGAFVIACAFGLLLLVGTRRAITIFAAIVVTSVTLYPVLRGSSLSPADSVYEIVNTFNAERAESFKFRLDNEDELLDRANQKPLFGWGSWGRNRIFDPRTGEDLSITDGDWILTIGVFGWFGYMSKYGLFAIPIIALARRRKAPQLTFAACGLCMIQAANILDAIPNATIVPVTWLIAGALAGFACRDDTPAVGAGAGTREIGGRARRGGIAPAPAALRPTSFNRTRG
ncbi:O-antigen ligase family protein [Albidovulum sediminicola]|uniref:O-antigen ligase-related domain-containing protein n=1 Tax=Albidovulum sediminicola TaxID=2984331 RepID=A0ABT2YYU7_9RHOB|nr:O-antigen ligase family protein [Defluviimonas sp. WL0075]MCV2864060.1 hypothetical protein [Defluviimonas sp. WL0075]